MSNPHRRVGANGARTVEMVLRSPPLSATELTAVLDRLYAPLGERDLLPVA